MIKPKELLQLPFRAKQMMIYNGIYLLILSESGKIYTVDMSLEL